MIGKPPPTVTEPLRRRERHRRGRRPHATKPPLWPPESPPRQTTDDLQHVATPPLARGMVGITEPHMVKIALTSERAYTSAL
jgi:hypothetical protein